jgi:hypothetical protein
VSSGGQFSNLLPVNVSVPQSSILGPFLFSFFINDLWGAVLTPVYTSGHPCDIFHCIHRLNLDLKAIFCWSSENG